MKKKTKAKKSKQPRILDEPVKHDLADCLEALRWGRPALQQKLLTALAEVVRELPPDQVLECLI